MAASQPLPEPVSYGRRLTELAAAHPEKDAIVYAAPDGAERRVSWAELDRRSSQVARLLAARGVGEGATVVVGLPNCPEHFLACFAAWKLGGLALPLRAALPAPERDALLALARPALVVAEWGELPYPTLSPADLDRAAGYADGPLPDRVPHPGRAVASGGATGRPKLVVAPGPLAAAPGAYAGLFGPLGFGVGQTQLVAGPLYHAMPFVTSHWGLFEDHTLVLMARFDAARAVDLIERHRVEWAYLAPTMMHRIIALPGLAARDFSSLRSIASTAAPCAPWLKRAWIALLGPERVAEAYLQSEGVGGAVIRGDEWLAHPGSVGKPYLTELRILDDAGNALPPGAVGEIYMRFDPQLLPSPRYHYIGAPAARATPDGLESVGDLGWLDEEGYLYIADRRVDLVITGGANVYPAEVEAALSEHPGIADVAVVGVPDREWGKRVHAVVEPRDPAAPPAVGELDAHCRARLASYKVPKSYEFLAALPRTEAGKIRRSALATEREGGWTPTMVAPARPARA